MRGWSRVRGGGSGRGPRRFRGGHHEPAAGQHGRGEENCVSAKTSTQEGGKTKTHHDRSFASRSTVRCVYSALQTAREAASLREYLTRIDRRMAAGVCNGGVMCNDDAGRGSRRDVAVRRRGGQKAEGNKTVPVPVHSLISASPTDPCSRIGGSRDEGQSCATLTPHATLRLSAGALGYFPAALFFPHDVGKCGGAIGQSARAPPRTPCDPLRSGPGCGSRSRL